MHVSHFTQAQPYDNGRGRFCEILDFFKGLKIGVPSGCLEETSIFKIIMIDDVTFYHSLNLYVVSLTI